MNLRKSARHARLLLLDAMDVLLRRRPDLVPPRREVEKIGGHDFLQLGRHLASIATDFGGLQPHERILDIGSGIGRMAVGLLDYLGTGEYAGFDIDPGGIAWCRKKIEPRHPNFRFTFVDVVNRHYNPRGSIAPEQFVFPYATSSMDVVFASSVFTHLATETADHYVGEVSRVLKPGGRFVGSFFLLNHHSRGVLDRAEPRFIPVEPHYAVQDPNDIEAAIAFDEETVRTGLSRHGLAPEEVRYGTWAHRERTLSFQDFVLARKA